LKKTVDVGPVLQELTNRPGWVKGNAVMLLVGKASGEGHPGRGNSPFRLPEPYLLLRFPGLEVAG
jgi:hypothetical protein